MPEPLTHSTLGAAVAAAATAAAAPPMANLLGFEYVAIGWAFMGGAIYLLWLGRMEQWWEACVSVFISTVLGTAFGHWFAAPVILGLVHYFEWLAPWQNEAREPVMGCMALLIGLFSQKAMPGLMKRVGVISEGNHA